MRERAALLRAIVEKSWGELERAVLATPDGVVLAVSNSSDFDDVLAALSAAVVASVGEAFRLHLLLGVKDVAVELEDGRVVVMRDLGDAVLCLVSRPRPNLGLIRLLLDRYSERIPAGAESGSETAVKK